MYESLILPLLLNPVTNTSSFAIDIARDALLHDVGSSCDGLLVCPGTAKSPLGAIDGLTELRRRVTGATGKLSNALSRSSYQSQEK